MRAAYQLEDDKLVRFIWPQLDRAQGIEAYENTLLEQITRIDFRYRDGSKQWHSQWPPLNPQQQGDDEAMRLVAIELTLELEDWGEIVRLYPVGG